MRFATVNFYVGNKQPFADIERLDNLNLDVIGFQEAWRHLEMIDHHLKKHRVYTSRRSDSKASNEVAVALHSRNELIGFSGREVSDVRPDEETSIFKSRWITVIKFKHKGKRYALLNYHGNAVTQSKKTGDLLTGLERVREWIEAAKEIDETIKDLKSRGFVVLVTGDFNYRRFPSIPRFTLAYWSPQRIFRRNGLEWVEHGLDYAAWSKSERKVGPAQIIPKEKTGADHDWIVVELA